ncbi:MAG: RDD family protein [Candidatus Obscuribacterales bacterium]|nr:RDD family protein [Candidatus Obscuribacterales bacterium]
MQNLESNAPVELIYAGFWLRVAACIIDSIIFGIPITIFQVALTFLSKAVGDPTVSLIVSLSMLVISAALYGLYGGLFESSKFQATPGKMLLKLKVTDLDGNRCSFARAFARYMGMGVSDATLYIGYLMAAWTEKKQCLHDKIANCLVVKV